MRVKVGAGQIGGNPRGTSKKEKEREERESINVKDAHSIRKLVT